jgi:hypothetical protein
MIFSLPTGLPILCNGDEGIFPKAPEKPDGMRRKA